MDLDVIPVTKVPFKVRGVHCLRVQEDELELYHFIGPARVYRQITALVIEVQAGIVDAVQRTRGGHSCLIDALLDGRVEPHEPCPLAGVVGVEGDPQPVTGGDELQRRLGIIRGIPTQFDDVTIISWRLYDDVIGTVMAISGVEIQCRDVEEDVVVLLYRDGGVTQEVGEVGPRRVEATDGTTGGGSGVVATWKVRRRSGGTVIK